MAIITVAFSATVHKSGGRFRVPLIVAKTIGVKSPGKIALSIRTPSGEPLFIGIATMRSDHEVYGTQVRHLKPGEQIIVEASSLPTARI
jgi:hypothetical protein